MELNYSEPYLNATKQKIVVCVSLSGAVLVATASSKPKSVKENFTECALNLSESDSFGGC